jgi:diguanylate cyclase (GGDEF)-like protein
MDWNGMVKKYRFLIVAITLGIVAILALILFYRQMFMASLITHQSRTNEALTEVFSRVNYDHYQPLVDLSDFSLTKEARSETIAILDKDVRRLMTGTGVLKIKIYNLDGLTVYSTDHSQIHEDKSSNPGFLSASTGDIASAITFRDQFDAFEGWHSNLNVVTSYVPVYRGDGEEMVAVFEVYSDVTSLVDEMRSALLRIVAGVLGSMAAFYSLLIWMALRSDRIESSLEEETSRSEANIRYQASHDSLTGLDNRYEFERRLNQLLDDTKKSKATHTLCLIDLDQFKLINDTCGHIAGDELLRQISRVLEASISSRDIIARLGGDEFAILLANCPPEKAREIIRNLLTKVQKHEFLWEGETHSMGASIGLVDVDINNPGASELMSQAETACYLAKEHGRNRIREFSPEDTLVVQRQSEMQWVKSIDDALSKDRFVLYAQQILPINGGTEIHYELLIRLLDDADHVIPPGVFLPAAERFDLMTKLDAWVVEKALTMLAENPEFCDEIHFVSVNLSGQSITDNTFCEIIIQRIKELGIEPSKICFEITETAAISNLKAATIFMSRLHQLGCLFALDDFGSGLSSFGYLKTLQVDFLKIDGLFVKEIVNNKIDREMVKSINDIGHVLGCETIAEYVENDEIRKCLMALGVDHAQGYGIHKPYPLKQLIEDRRHHLDNRT